MNRNTLPDSTHYTCSETAQISFDVFSCCAGTFQSLFLSSCRLNSVVSEWRFVLPCRCWQWSVLLSPALDAQPDQLQHIPPSSSVCHSTLCWLGTPPWRAERHQQICGGDLAVQAPLSLSLSAFLSPHVEVGVGVCVCEARWYESSRTVALGPLFYYNRVVSGTRTLVLLLLGPGSISASVCWLLLVSLKELSRGVAVEFVCLSTIANKIFSNIISWK